MALTWLAPLFAGLEVEVAAVPAVDVGEELELDTISS
jgi:hypothetical protein